MKKKAAMLEVKLGDEVFISLKSIRSYYGELNPQALDKILAAIERALNNVAQAPSRYPVCHFAPTARFHIVAAYPRYSLIYSFDDLEVRVHTLWDSKQDPAQT